VPKEAALDYVSDGMWRDAREDARHHQRGTGETRQATAEDRAAANDNFRERIARDIRHAVNGWHHGAAVDAFAAERGTRAMPSRSAAPSARPSTGTAR